MNILVIGGTGPTGPFIVNGLVERGHDVTVLHSGKHELDSLPDETVVPHIHANAFDEDAFREAIRGRRFDVVFAMYGRLRSILRVLEGQTDRLFTIGGIAVYEGFSDAERDVMPRGVRVPAREDAPRAGPEAAQKIRRIRETEDLIFSLHPTATHFRYPLIYGPHQIIPREWPIVRRALDRRPFLLLPDGGLTLMSAAYSANAAHAVLLAFDRRDASEGEFYNVADDRQFDLHMVAQIVADELDHEWEIVSLPYAVAYPSFPLLQNHSSTHRLVDTGKIRDQLGYRDRVDPEVGLRETIRWERDHLYGNSARLDRNLQDPFDYDAEDALLAHYRDFVERCAKVPFESRPGYSFGYYGPRENPGGSRGSYRA
ncbi:MAG: NAD-dependent epimerase/dehydratase family protein [Myxococcales bacterium]|nr:NAD-dependent epimerase/dehydratase family protein [Myxococcales bacterium]